MGYGGAVVQFTSNQAGIPSKQLLGLTELYQIHHFKTSYHSSKGSYCCQEVDTAIGLDVAQNGPHVELRHCCVLKMNTGV